MPDRPENTAEEAVATMRGLLDSPDPGHQESAIMEALEYADQVASAAWIAAEGQPSVERFQLALQAAVELLQGIGLALAQGAGEAPRRATKG